MYLHYNFYVNIQNYLQLSYDYINFHGRLGTTQNTDKRIAV